MIKLYVHSKPCTCCISFHCTAINWLNLTNIFYYPMANSSHLLFFIPDHYVCLNYILLISYCKKQNKNFKLKTSPRLLKCTVYECVFFTVCDQSFHLFRWSNADRNNNTDATNGDGHDIKK